MDESMDPTVSIACTATSLKTSFPDRLPTYANAMTFDRPHLHPRDDGSVDTTQLHSQSHEICAPPRERSNEHRCPDAGTSEWRIDGSLHTGLRDEFLQE